MSFGRFSETDWRDEINPGSAWERREFFGGIKSMLDARLSLDRAHGREEPDYHSVEGSLMRLVEAHLGFANAQINAIPDPASSVPGEEETPS